MDKMKRSGWRVRRIMISAIVVAALVFGSYSWNHVGVREVERCLVQIERQWVIHRAGGPPGRRPAEPGRWATAKLSMPWDVEVPR